MDLLFSTIPEFCIRLRPCKGRRGPNQIVPQGSEGYAPVMGTVEAHPSGLHPGALAAQVLDFIGEQKLSLLGLAAASDVIAADCRFNWWVGVEVKRVGLNEAGWLELLDRLESADRRAREAMRVFATDLQDDALLKAFSEVTADLNDRSLPVTTR